MNSGFVAIVGPPNAGKSTFLNHVLGFKLAITSDKPQTTRHRLLGVCNSPEAQIVFLDTPGLHKPMRALNKLMVRTAMAALQDVEAVLFMVEASAKGLAEGQRVAGMLAEAKKPVVLALNKIDLVRDKAALLPMLERVAGWAEWAAIVPLSAAKGDGAAAVLRELAGLLPQGPAIFPEDMITDLSERFLVSELIREKVFALTNQELPYSTAVTIDEFIEPQNQRGVVAITATIHVERQGQKGILIGKGGGMLKKIGASARLDIETMLGQKVYLDLFVRVEPKWSSQAHGLRKLGYEE